MMEEKCPNHAFVYTWHSPRHFQERNECDANFSVSDM
jgi:hypothetical protein